MSNMIIDETLGTAFTTSIMDELRLLDPDPPEDEYIGIHDEPPAYDTFELACEHWCDADKAKQKEKKP